MKELASVQSEMLPAQVLVERTFVKSHKYTMSLQQDEPRDREDYAPFTVGVVGGMGPAATHQFFGQVIDHTPASQDQDHLRILIDNNPEIPDRTRFLAGDGPDPRPLLIKTAQTLADSGADVLTMPCNTAHAFVSDIGTAIDPPLLNMISLTRRTIESKVSAGRVGLLSTDGTIRAGVYHDEFENSPLDLVVPDNKVQEEKIMEAIYGPEGIKAGYCNLPRQQLLDAIAAFDTVDAVIFGCTELPLVLDTEAISVPAFDPMEIMAKSVVKRAPKVKTPTDN